MHCEAPFPACVVAEVFFTLEHSLPQCCALTKRRVKSIGWSWIGTLSADINVSLGASSTILVSHFVTKSSLFEPLERSMQTGPASPYHQTSIEYLKFRWLRRTTTGLNFKRCVPSKRSVAAVDLAALHNCGSTLTSLESVPNLTICPFQRFTASESMLLSGNEIWANLALKLIFELVNSNMIFIFHQIK